MEVILSAALKPVIDEALELLTKQMRHKQKTGVVAIAIFDLPNSTKIKLTEGHTKGTRLALEHNLICEKIAQSFGGSVIKHMGDGVFIEFKDPIKACQAALKIKKATIEDGRFVTKGGITLGVVESIEIGGIRDLLGSTVDRCARLVSMAIPNQILVDQVLLMSLESFLRDNKRIMISEPSTIKARGIGDLSVYELSIEPYGFAGFGLPYLRIIEEGRMPLKEKVEFLSSATEDIIELGIGLSSFSDNYYRQRSTEWKDRLICLLRKGVVIRCVILDPDSRIARIYLTDNKELSYLQRMKESLKKLLDIKAEFRKQGLDNFKILAYDAIPRFHASCIDIDKPFGKMSVSHYLPQTLRSENPVIQFSKYSNPELFEKYKSIVKNVLSNTSEIEKRAPQKESS